MRGLFPLFVTDGCLRKTSDFCGRLRTSSGIFGNDCVVFKNPSTPRIKISRLYFRKSWQVYMRLNLLTCMCQILCNVLSILLQNLDCSYPTARNFWVGVWLWNPGTLSLYQSWFSWILLPYTRVNSPNHSYPRVAVFQKLTPLAQSKAN